MKDEFFNTLIKNKVSIHVSGYKPTYSLLDQINQCLKSHSLNYTILKREVFVKYYTTEPNNKMTQSYENCFASGCRELYRGKLSRCSAAIAFEKFNNQFGTDYKVLKGIDWFDIHDENINAWKLKDDLDCPSHMCRYCSDSKKESFEWDYAGAKPKLEDYIIGK